MSGGGLARTLTVALAATAALLVVLRFEPRIGALARSVSDGEALLRNDEVAFATEPQLRDERAGLRRTLRSFLTVPPETAFVRDLSRIARRRHVRILSSSFQRASEAGVPRSGGLRPGAPLGAAAGQPPHGRMGELHAALSLEGGYADLLEAIADLSRGDALVSVETPTIRRSAVALVAEVPVTLYEPPLAGTLSEPPPGVP
jgi:hypothetical protein